MITTLFQFGSSAVKLPIFSGGGTTTDQIDFIVSLLPDKYSTGPHPKSIKMPHRLMWNEHVLPHTKNSRREDTMIILVKFFILN